MSQDHSARGLGVDRRDLVPLLLISLVVVVMIPGRFAGQLPDSRHYLELAAYFEGADIELTGPFAYRVAIPWLVAKLSLASNAVEFGLISALSTIVAHAIMYLLARSMTGRRDLALLGVGFCALSPVVFSYSARALTDGPGFLLITLCVWLLHARRFVAFLVVVSVSMLVREAVLVVFVSFGFVQLAEAARSRRLTPALWLLGIVAPLLVLMLVRGALTDVVSEPRLTRTTWWAPQV
jgi:hypothetical protein